MLLAACSEPPIREQIRQQVKAFETAVESASLGDAMALVSEAYKDRYHMNRKALAASLFVQFKRHQNIHLFTRISHIDPDASGTRAQLVIYAGMAGRGESLLDMTADVYRFDVQMQLENDEWRIVTAHWQAATADDLGGDFLLPQT